MHKDEGYITPSQDLIIYNCNSLWYYPWDNLDSKKFACMWECYGIASEYKNCPYIFFKKYSSSQIWRVVHAYDVTNYLPTISSKCLTMEQLGVALKNLLTGVESNVFQYSTEKNAFVMQDGLCLCGSSENIFKCCCEPFIHCANYFYYLSGMLNSTYEPSHGIPSVFQALRNSIKFYLQCYSGIIQEMLSVQHFLQTYHWINTLQNHLYFLLSIFRAGNASRKGTLIALLYDEVSLVNKTEVSFILNYILQTCCNVYFSLLKKWIFEGECIDKHQEFFIEASTLSESFLNHKFWSHAFVLNKMLVPGFLKDLESDIFVCGKSMALLKLCNQDDPLFLGMKQGYPNLVCNINKTHLAELEKECLEYKERVNSFSYHKNENIKTDHDYDYYATLAAQSLCRIKRNQEEQKMMMNKKKHSEFLMLKKNIEASKILKMQNKEVCQEEESITLKKKQRSSYINSLRENDERQNIVNLYLAKSEVVRNRIQKTEWKIRRALLHEKRIEFFKKVALLAKIRISDHIELNNINNISSTLIRGDENNFDFASPLSAVPNSCVPADEKCNYPINNKKPLKLYEKSQTQSENESHDYSFIKEINYDDAVKPLDVSEGARQEALIFKETNIYGTCNILPEEVISCSKKNNEKKSYVSPKTLFSFDSSILEMDSSNQFNKENKETMLNVSKESGITSVLCEDLTQTLQPLLSHIFNSAVDIEVPMLTDKSTTDKCSEISYSNLNDIDMTTTYQNLQASIKIPLITQLELTNKAVMRLFFEKHNLLCHLKCIKEYFFLFDGNFSKMLATNLFYEIQIMQKPPSHLLNVSMLNSILCLSIGSKSNDEYTERLSFFINEIPDILRPTDPEALKCISLQYNMYWPLNIIVTDAFINNCDKIFRFLLQVQRVSWVLEQDFYLLKDKTDDQQFRQIHLFRHMMSHFVNTIKMYVYSIALDESWKEFEKDLQEAKTLDDVYKNSVACIKIVLSRCLLTRKCKGLKNELVNLFGIILKFHEALRSGEWIEENGICRFSNIEDLTHFFNLFLMFSRILHKNINGFASCSHQLYLKQLVVLLSTNDFYTE